MKHKIQVFLSAVACLLLALPLTAQKDGDWINRLVEEDGWVPYSEAMGRKNTVEKLYVKRNGPVSLMDLTSFGDLKGLIIVDTELKDLNFLEAFPNLKVFECQGNGLKTLEGIQYLTKAEEVSVKSNFITDVSPLKDLTQLKMLNLYENEIVEIDSLYKMSQLQYLDLSKNKIRSIEVLKDWQELVYLSVYSCYDLKSVAEVANFRKLNTLNISFLDIPDLSFDFLDSLSVLENLRIQGVVPHDSSLNHVAGLRTLRTLTMGKNDSVTDINALDSLVLLEYLDIHSNNIKEISVVQNYPRLIKLVMYRNQVKDLRALGECLELRSLFLFENPIEDYSPLHDMDFLQHLHLNKKDFNATTGPKFKQELPKTEILFM